MDPPFCLGSPCFPIGHFRCRRLGGSTSILSVSDIREWEASIPFVALQRKVFDGLIPHTGSNARGSFNHRFAQPSRAVDASYFYPGDQFPFSDVMQTDPVIGVEDSLLARVSPETTPMIFYTNTSTEYWRLPTALIHTTVDGKTDVPPADTSRI